MNYEKLKKNMEELLDRFNYLYTEEALDTIISTWEENKRDLINHLRKHPNWNEDELMIVFPHEEYERKVDDLGICKFKEWFLDAYFWRCASTLKCDSLYFLLFDSKFLYTSTVTEDEKKSLDSVLPNLHAHVGAKKSRLVNKIAAALGINKNSEYNREFAAYSDCLNVLRYNRTTVISVNPLDYWTMSFGNSWSSCHTIDRNNLRGMPNGYHGQYSSGTTSYMLDGSSMILYTIDDKYEGDEYWNQDKINRQVFHYSEGKLVQGRLYPQDNDGNDDGYTPFRNIVQKAIADCYGFSNLWTLKKGTEYASRYIESCGTNYRDYQFYGNCNLSLSQDGYSETHFKVGHMPICIYCGNEHNTEGSITCCNVHRCAKCGCLIEDDDEYHEINGEIYCEDCCFYCPECGSWHTGEGREVDGLDICEYCYENNCSTCVCCGDIHRDCNMFNLPDGTRVCTDCAEAHFTRCSCCNEYIRNEEIVDIGYDRICHPCRDRYYTRCDSCGMYFRSRFVYTDRNGRSRCVWCPVEVTFENENQEES